MPNDKELEGTHYLNPGPGYRQAVAHGLFGAIAVEPEGSTYLHPDTGLPLRSGWEAMIKPRDKAAFREYVKVYHEIGDEKAPVYDRRRPPAADRRPDHGGLSPRLARHQLPLRAVHEPPRPRGRQEVVLVQLLHVRRPGDADDARLLRRSVEDPHHPRRVGDVPRLPPARRRHPLAAEPARRPELGLREDRPAKNPRLGGTNRLDSQSFGPGESYTLEIEGGAGGVQRAVGDLLEHCHIAEHYVAGMWSFWRVYNTRQVDLKPLPGRAAPPAPVDSAGLIGRTMADGTTLTKDNLGSWIKELIPPRGVPRDGEDGSVWNWSIDNSDPEQARLPRRARGDRGLARTCPTRSNGHRGLPGDVFVGNRPKILFNPVDGRIRATRSCGPNIGQRPPLTPNGHTGTPFLGNTAMAASTKPANPWAAREDGLCPQDSPVRKFNLTSIQLPIKISGQGTDPTGKIFVLNEDKADVLAGRKPAEPLALRANIGDCVALTLVTEFEQDGPAAHMPQSNMHIHHVQFDPQGSDGASAGMVYDQSIRPYKLVDPRMTADARRRRRRCCTSTSVAKFQVGVFIGVGLGTEEFEIREITAIDADAQTVTLDTPLSRDHAAGEWAGTEFVQERWYPDVDLDNVFWHDHVDGIHGWGKGLVGQLIVEPKGSTYHDPKTGEEVRSGSYVDIRTNNPMAPGLVDGSFRELALWTIGDNPITDSTLNLRAEPWSERLAGDPDPSLLFSSYRHGDPRTPLPTAYRNDPFVVRTVNVTGNGIDSLHVDRPPLLHGVQAARRAGQGAWGRRRTPSSTACPASSPPCSRAAPAARRATRATTCTWTASAGASARAPGACSGCSPAARPTCSRCPGTTVADGLTRRRSRTDGRPPVLASAGQPCPTGAPTRSFAVSAVDLPGGAEEGTRSAFVPTALAADVQAGRVAPEPLVAARRRGRVRHRRADERARRRRGRPSTSTSWRARRRRRASTPASTPSRRSRPAGSARYRYYVDSREDRQRADLRLRRQRLGRPRASTAPFVVAPEGAKFSDPAHGPPARRRHADRREAPRRRRLPGLLA